MKTLVRRAWLDFSKIHSDPWIQHTRKLRRESHRSVQQAIPTCATQCVGDFISTNFPPSVCPNPEDLHCLCTKRSSNGLTIGEGAVQCLLSTCSSILDFKAYGICSGIENALPNTHSALTVTVATTPSIPKTSDAGSAPTPTLLRRTSSAIATPAISIASSLNTRDVTTVSPSTPQESSVNSTPVSAPIMTPVPTSTTSGMVAAERSRIIGLSVGAAVVGLVLLGIVMFLCARKRRSKIRQQEKNHNFEIGGEMSEPEAPVTLTSSQLGPVPPTPIGLYNRPIVEHLGPVPKVHVSPACNKSPSWESRPFVADDSNLARSQSSPTSKTLTARLLPKGSYNGHFPRKYPVEGSEGCTKYHQLPLHDPGSSPVNGSVLHRDAQVDMPRQSQALGTWFTYPDSSAEKSPVYGHHLSPRRTSINSASSTPPCESSPTTKLVGYNLASRNYSGQRSQISEFHTDPSTYSRSRITDDGQNTFVMVTHRAQGPSYRDSTASMTSFETTDSDYDGNYDDAPSKLSPVKEYPSPELRGTGSFDTNGTSHQPTSSQRPPPKTHSWESSQPSTGPGSLLAKRRGESFAGKLENGFTVPSNQPRRARGPARGLPSNPRSATRPPRLWERQITQTADQLWSVAEPSPGPRKLTPTRDGDNLVLRFD